MADAVSLLQLVLRWLHFVGGFGWLGSLAFLAAVLSPSLSRLAAPQRVALLEAVAPRLNQLLIATSIVNVVAGASLALVRSNLEAGIFLGSQWGLAILSGAIIALILLAITAGIILPLLEHYIPNVDETAFSRVSEEESASLEVRLRRWSGLAAGLGVAVLFFMALAVSPI